MTPVEGKGEKLTGLGRESLRPICRSDKVSTSLTGLKQKLSIRRVPMDRNGHPQCSVIGWELPGEAWFGSKSEELPEDGKN